MDKSIEEYQESLENKEIIIELLKEKVDNLNIELENYSFEMIQTTKNGYKMYRLDPYFKETKIEELQDFRDNIKNPTIKKITQEIIFCIDKEEIPEIVLLNENEYQILQEYFDEILQNDNDKKIHLPEISLTVYVCKDLKKLIVK